MVIEKEVKSLGDKLVAIIHISGVIKLGESAHIFFSWAESIQEENVVMDMGAIDYFDSTGLGEFVGYCGKFVEKGQKPVFLNPSHRILSLLRVTGLDSLIKVFTDEAEAVKSFAN